MKQNIATLLDSLPMAAYNVPELELRRTAAGANSFVVSELKYTHKNDKTVSVRAVSDEPDEVRHSDITGTKYSLPAAPKQAFARFAEYAAKIYKLRGTLKLCEVLGISVDDLHLIRITPNWVYIEFTDIDGTLIGMKIGGSGYIQVYNMTNIADGADGSYRLTQLAHKRPAKVSDIVHSAKRFVEAADYFAYSEDA